MTKASIYRKEIFSLLRKTGVPDVSYTSAVRWSYQYRPCPVRSLGGKVISRSLGDHTILDVLRNRLPPLTAPKSMVFRHCLFTKIGFRVLVDVILRYRVKKGGVSR